MAKTLEQRYSYLANRVKLERYKAAIERIVGAKKVVLDLFPSASATSSFIRQVLAWDTSE